MSKYALEVKNISKSFRLPTEQANGIKQAFVNWTKGVKGYKEQHVLTDISFKVEKGDLVFARTGATTGKSFLINNCPPAVYASYLIRVQINNSQIFDKSLIINFL